MLTTKAHRTRRQLTLFVAEPWGSRLDLLRSMLDPIQAQLISTHVTLCREDEIEGLSDAVLLNRASTWPFGSVRIGFGSAQRFDGHGIYLPGVARTSEFNHLREWLLQSKNIRVPNAHITLAHPRNPAAIGNTDQTIAQCFKSLELEFETVTLIEQIDQSPWNRIGQVRLTKA